MTNLIIFYIYAGLIFILVGALDGFLLAKAGKIQKFYDDFPAIDAFDSKIKKGIVLMTIAAFSVAVGLLWWYYIILMLVHKIDGTDPFDDF